MVYNRFRRRRSYRYRRRSVPRWQAQGFRSEAFSKLPVAQRRAIVRREAAEAHRIEAQKPKPKYRWVREPYGRFGGRWEEV